MADINIITDQSSLTVPEGGTAQLRVRLSAKPETTVTLSTYRSSGDSSLRVASGSSLRFSPWNYGTYQTVTFAADPDTDTVAGSAVFRMGGDHLVTRDFTVREAERTTTTTPAIVTDMAAVTVPEGGTAAFQVKLSAKPAANVTVSVARYSGDVDLNVVSGASLTFTPTNYATYQIVTLSAAVDADTTNGQAVFRLSASGLASKDITATESDKTVPQPSVAILTDTAAISVPEGGKATFQVKLSAAPAANVAVTAAMFSGDQDITIASGGTLTFTPANYATYQTVTVAAAADADAINGQAIIRLSGNGLASKDVTATEIDSTAVLSERIVIDPVTRIEGHLRIEVQISGGKVSDAWSTCTLFRGIETILQNRDPMDAPHITQRLCGVCTYIHQLCSTRAIENSISLTVTDNARIVRNLLLGTQFLHDHMVHFYQLHGLDWVDIVSALSADPYKTATLARTISPAAPVIDFAAVQNRLKGLANSGSLGPFNNAYWGHSAYKLAPEENLLMAAHYLEALKQQVRTARMMAILGGKNPHPMGAVVGGVTCGGELNANRLASFKTLLDESIGFVETVYMPDLTLVAQRYPEWKAIGQFRDMLAFGEFPQTSTEPGSLFLPRGAIFDGNITNVQPVDQNVISEHVAHAWYQGTTALHPSKGVTQPAYTPFDTTGRYSWSKAPRYNGRPMEVGPLARVLVAYGSNHPQIVTEVNAVLTATGMTAGDLFSTLGRTAARAVETKVLGRAMQGWLDQIGKNLTAGNRQIYKGYTKPATTSGVGFNEAPRGALGHWLNTSNGKIANYQMVVPSTWNFGPRDQAGLRGPLEKALIGTPVADPAKPVEILRVIHSYDPCLACAVHVLDAKKEEVAVVKVL